MPFVEYSKIPKSTDWRENMIPYEPTQADYEAIEAWAVHMGTDVYAYQGCIASHWWKVSVTPSSDAEKVYLSLTCRDRSHVLDGKTINVRDCPTDWMILFPAWFIEKISGLPDKLIDDFLNLGSGAFQNVPADAEKSNPDDDIPF